VHIIYYTLVTLRIIDIHSNFCGIIWENKSLWSYERTICSNVCTWYVFLNHWENKTGVKHYSYYKYYNGIYVCDLFLYYLIPGYDVQLITTYNLSVYTCCL